MKNFLPNFLITLMMVFTLAGAGCPGCPPPNPDTTLGKIINCAGLSGTQAIPLIPKVNDCLTRAVDWKTCLISLLNPTANITTDILACVVRDQGMKFAEGADDELEASAACAADEFITSYILGEKQMSFTDGYTPPEGSDKQVCGVLLQSRASK